LSYLADLTTRLISGLGNLDPAVPQFHGDYLRAIQQSDGGFAGREGESDLYYTGFAVRGLAITGQLDEPVLNRLAEFLRPRTGRLSTVIDLVSWLYAARLLETLSGIEVAPGGVDDQWSTNVAGMLEALRRDDGGYAKGPDGKMSSTYHTFLALLCCELLELPVHHSDELASFVRSQQRDDGGFVELALMQRSGTNPTAAAIGALQMLGDVPAAVSQAAAGFLAGMQTEEGGLRANTRIPIADLLSTFTGLVTLLQLDSGALIDAGAAKRYAVSLQCDTGGFRGATWDVDPDAEYTFYGLGTLALLATAPGD
jgi:geranylgeranyl transferase type-2 subunit beta